MCCRLSWLAGFPLLLALVVVPAQATVITDTVGDVDCFGLGGSCADGDLYVSDLGGSFSDDNRESDDNTSAPHTDHWDSPVTPTWTHSYSLGAETPVSGSLGLFIAGFADIGAVDLLADGSVIQTYDFPGQFQTVHDLTAFVPVGLLDGSTTFSLSTAGADGFTIDHSTLTVTTETRAPAVPEPGILGLLGIGLLALGAVTARHREID